MIKAERIEIWGLRHAIRGMRNPKKSWDKSDSYETHVENPETMNTAHFQFFAGEKDLDLMNRLYNAGTEHRKFMRQIFVSMDITAPLYWWKEFDTYKIGTTENSTSTMHTLHKEPVTADLFSYDDFEIIDGVTLFECFKSISNICEYLREEYIATGDERYWRALIQLLPESFNQMRTVTMNYENVVNIIHQRENHKLSEWRELVGILRELPYIEDITAPNTGSRHNG